MGSICSFLPLPIDTCPIWEDKSLRLRKYAPFIHIEEDKVKTEIVQTVEKTLIQE